MAASLESANETLIVSLARTGDKSAFAEIVRRRQAWVRSLMRRLALDTDLADDLAQQVFLKAFEDISKLRDSRRFPGWLKQLAINVWRQHLRKNRIDLKSDDESIEPSAANGTALQLDLDGALAHLSEKERTCVVLFGHEGMTHDEISTATGMPLGTVKSHIRRGSGKLQSLLQAYDSKEHSQEDNHDE